MQTRELLQIITYLALGDLIGYNGTYMDTTVIVPKGEVGSYVKELLPELVRNASLDAATILTLTGDLGAGKTTLVQSLAQALGVIEVVTSPTFVMMKAYETKDTVFTTLVHIDAYRIDDVDELRPLHINQVLLSPQTLVCIEWPEKIASALPTAVTAVSLTAQPDGSRTCTYHGF